MSASPVALAADGTGPVPLTAAPTRSWLASRWVDLVLAIGLGVLAFLLCAYQIDRNALWHDEVYSVDAVRFGWAGLAEHVVEREVNMLTYYLLLGAWMLVSFDDAWIRLLSAVFAGLSVVATYGLGRTLFDRRVAVLGAALLATSAFFIEYGQEARTYTLAAFLAVASTFALVRAIRAPHWTRWTIYVLLAALIPYTHVVLLAILPAHAVAVLTARPRPTIRTMAAVLAGVGLLIAPALYLAALQQEGVLGWVTQVSAMGVWVALRGYLGGGVAGPLEEVGIPAAIRVLPIVALGLAGMGIVAGLRDPARRWPVGLIVAWAVLPILATIAISVLKPMFVHRYLIYVVPPLCLLVALGAMALPRPWLRGAAAALVLVLTVNSALGWYGSETRPDWRTATAWLVARSSVDDRAYYFGDFGRVVPFYARAAGTQDRVPTLLYGLSYRSPTLAADLERTGRNVAGRGRTLWLIITMPPYQSPAQDPRFGPLGRVMRLAEVVRFEHIVIARYVPRG